LAITRIKHHKFVDLSAHDKRRLIAERNVIRKYGSRILFLRIHSLARTTEKKPAIAILHELHKILNDFRCKAAFYPRHIYNYLIKRLTYCGWNWLNIPQNERSINVRDVY